MEKKTILWPIKHLLEVNSSIEYPDYQREAFVWNLQKKQRLIDSIIRGFDIAPLYLFMKSADSYDCIDGRQRINAILSFAGLNTGADNGFELHIMNEICRENDELTNKFENKTYIELQNAKPPLTDIILNYNLTVTIIEKVDDESELNLQFLRLQLGSMLNSGEKLHAMTGQIRDYIFNTLSKHPYFQVLDIPNRRYAREQVAAQVVINYFTWKKERDFHSSRYTDLQEFFKEYSVFDENAEQYAANIIKLLNQICSKFEANIRLIKNRAIAVSLFIYLTHIIEEGNIEDLEPFISFFDLFIRTLKWQLPLGLDMDRSYQDLLKFQNYVSQAAGEKYAIQGRNAIWNEYFEYYKRTGTIKGDEEYIRKNDRQPER